MTIIIYGGKVYNVSKEVKGMILLRLTETIEKKNYTIEKISLEEDVTRRFYSLGMTENTELTVLGAKRNGARIIKVRGSRFAVGKSFCEEIYVKGDRT